MDTPFKVRCQILAEVWVEYRKDEEFTDYIEYCDLGLPLAYLVLEGVVENTPIAEKYINESFDLLLSGLGVEDENFENLDELLDLAEENNS
jgi:hypothetical protein